MISFRSLTPLAALALLGSVSIGQAADKPPIDTLDYPANADKQKVCAEAEKRYQDKFKQFVDGDPAAVVKMYDYTFCDPRTEIAVGDKVAFVNVDERTSHSVWFKGEGWEESVRMFPEEVTTYTFDKPGTYRYICGPHGYSEGMRGIVEVKPKM